MDKAFDISTTIRTLRRMTQTPNPANPDRMMLTIEDLDKESPDSAYWRKQALKNIPLSDHGTAFFMKPHKNLLRENPNDISAEIKVSEERDFSPTPRQESEVSRIDSHLLLPKTQEDHSAISVDNLSW